MAIRKGKDVVGSFKNHVFRKWRDINVVQSAPGEGGVKQTDATKKSSLVFGLASNLARNIRDMFSFFILKLYDGSNNNRMTTLLRSILEKCLDKSTNTYTFVQDSFDRLNGLELNTNSPLTESMMVIPTSSYKDGIITINFPELINNQQFIFPKETSSCTVVMGTESYRLEDSTVSRGRQTHQFEVDNQQQLIEKQSFEFKVPNGCLCIVGITLHYHKNNLYGKNLINNKTLNPAAICAAIVTPGDFEIDPELYWTKPVWKPVGKAYKKIPKAKIKVTSGKSATTDQASPRSQP